MDIDSQAVEVTKLSLLLKVLEGESEQSINLQLKMFRERALPDLSSNIRCGNSLIGSDFYEGQQQALFDDEEQRIRINAFDWEDEFPETMKRGGFDVVIGNPPYIRVQAMNEWTPQSLPYFKQHYRSAAKGNYDIYAVFAERGLNLLNKTGLLGFILPHKFFNATYGEGLRALIAEGQHLSHVVHFGHQQVFAGATTYTCLMFLSRQRASRILFVKVDNLDGWRLAGRAEQGHVPIKRLTPTEWTFSIGPSAELLARLRALPTKLSDVTSRIFQGIKTSADRIYIVEERGRKRDRVKVYSRQLEQECWLEPELLHPLVKGGDSRRYCMTRTARLVLFPYAAKGGVVALIPAEDLCRRFPLTWDYLEANRNYLADREGGRMRGPKWYGYIYPKALDVMHLPKLFTPDIAPNAAFSRDETGDVFFTGGVAGGYGLLVRPEYSREYMLGLLNSRLLEWYVKQTATQMRGGWYSFEARFIRGLPIETCSLQDRAERTMHDKMVKLVERMLDLHKKLPKAKGATKTAIERRIKATDRNIDQLVYELYGLSDKEIAIVEGQNG